MRLKRDEPLSNFSYNFNLRRYISEYTKWFGASKLKKLTLTKAAGPPPSRSGPTGVKAHVARPHTALKVPAGVAAPAAKPSNPDGGRARRIFFTTS